MDFLYKDLKFWAWLKKMHILRKYSPLQQGTHKIEFLCYSDVSMHFAYNVMKILNHRNKNVWSKMLSSSLYTMFKLCKTSCISSKTVRLWLRNAVRLLTSDDRSMCYIPQLRPIKMVLIRFQNVPSLSTLRASKTPATILKSIDVYFIYAL